MLREKIFKHYIIHCKNTSGYERLKHLELLIYGVKPFCNPPVSHSPSRISDARWQVYPFHTFITTLKHWLLYMQHNMYSTVYNVVYILCVCVYICVCVCMNSVWLPELLICFYLAFYHFIFLRVSWYVLSEHFRFSFPIIYLANLRYFLLSMKLKVNLSSCIKMSWNFY